MKYFKSLLLIFVFSTVLFSCHNEVESKVADILMLSSEVQEIKLGEQVDFSHFSVKVNAKEDVTSEAKFFVNGELYDKKIFFPEVAGEYIFYATYGDKKETLKSNEVTVKVLPIDATSFVKHPVVEGYVHSKCPYCPKLYYAIKEVEKVTDKVVFVVNHPIEDLHGKEDFLYEKSCVPLRADFVEKYKKYDDGDTFKSRWVPNADIDRKKYWKNPQPEKLEEVTNLLENKSMIGLSLRFVKNEEKYDVLVKTQFLEKFSQGLKLTVYLLENNITHDYPNNTEYFDGVPLIKNLVNDHIFRYSLTDIFGDDIPQEKSQKNGLYVKNFSVDIPSNITNKNKVSVVAFVTSKEEKHIINARVITLGDKEQSFEGE